LSDNVAFPVVEYDVPTTRDGGHKIAVDLLSVCMAEEWTGSTTRIVVAGGGGGFIILKYYKDFIDDWMRARA
jgi:hypothetical protein